jgi:hypothetical protein
MANTLLEIVNRVYNHLWVDDDSTTYGKSVRVVPKINDVVAQICRREYKNLLKQNMIKGGDLRFLRKQTFIQRYDNKPLLADANVGATTISASPTIVWPANWYLYLNGEVVQYGPVSGNTIFLLTPLKQHARKWDHISVVYKIPSEANDTFELYRILKNGWLEETHYSDFRYPADADEFYTIVGNDTTTDNFLRLNFYNSVSMYNFWLFYYIKATKMANDSDTCILPDEYGNELVAHLAAGELLYETEQNKASEAFLNEGYWALQEFYNNFSSFNKDYRKAFQWKRRTPMFPFYHAWTNRWVR